MSFRYVSNNGDVIEFGGDSPYYADADAFREYEVDYSMVRNTVTRFTNDPAKVTFPITISAKTQEPTRRGASRSTTTTLTPS